MNDLPFQLNLNDFVPKETALKLSTMPGVDFTLCRWSLRVRCWAMDKYTPAGLKEIFDKMKIEPIAEMAYFMLKDKSAVPTLPEFLDLVCTVQDQINLTKALLGAVGVGEPELKKIDEAMKVAGLEPPKPKAPKKKIGAKSSIP